MGENTLEKLRVIETPSPVIYCEVLINGSYMPAGYRVVKQKSRRPLNFQRPRGSVAFLWESPSWFRNLVINLWGMRGRLPTGLLWVGGQG